MKNSLDGSDGKSASGRLVCSVRSRRLTGGDVGRSVALRDVENFLCLILRHIEGEARVERMVGYDGMGQRGCSWLFGDITISNK